MSESINQFSAFAFAGRFIFALLTLPLFTVY